MIQKSRHAGERGMVLITTLLLLIVVTILAVGMFRSFGMDEKIAGNSREKQLALNAAESAEQYAEAWIASGGNGAGITAITCAVPATAPAVQVCNNAITNPVSLPWTDGVKYTLPTIANYPTNFALYLQPNFYIQRLPGTLFGGTAYVIDAAGYGGSPSTAAVVEATFLCIVKVPNSPGGVGNGGTAGTTC